MSDDIVTRLRGKYQGQLPICIEAADEIERLRKIIKDFYYEELNYQDAMHANADLEYIIPQSWKNAYQAFKEEATK